MSSMVTVVVTCVLLTLIITTHCQAREWTGERAAQQSIEASHVLAEYRSRANQAQFQNQQVEAARNPTLSFSSSYGYLTPTVAFQAGPSSISSAVAYNYSLGLSFRQLLTNFGELESALEASRLAQKVVEFQHLDQEERIREETLVMFYHAALAEDLVVAAQAALNSRQLALKESKQRFEAGNVSRYDVLRSQTLVAQAKQAVVEAEREVNNSRHQLFISIGVSNRQEETLTHPDGQIAPPPQDLPNATRTALRQRYDVQAALAAHQEAQARIEQTARSNSPRLELQSEYLRRNGTAIQSGQQWTVGLELAVPIFDGGVTSAKTEKANEVANQYEAVYLNTCRQAEKELAGLFEELQAKFSATETAMTALESAREASRIGHLRYRAGLTTLLEFSESESTCIEAEASLKRSRYQYRIAWAHWKRACGAGQ
jgi:outer membrane protein